MFISAVQLARKYHPDTNKDKGAQEKFVEIQAAYDVRPFLFLNCALRFLLTWHCCRFLVTRRSARRTINTEKHLNNLVSIRMHSRTQEDRLGEEDSVGSKILHLSSEGRQVVAPITWDMMCLRRYLGLRLEGGVGEDGVQEIFVVMTSRLMLHSVFSMPRREQKRQSTSILSPAVLLVRELD